MKVSVYKREDGSRDVLIQASPGKGRSPVLLQGVTKENLKGAVLEAVDAARQPRLRLAKWNL